METFLILLVVLVALFFWFARRGRTNAPIYISNPQFAMLDLKGGRASGLMAEDCDLLTPLLGKPLQTTSVTKCDILFLYCDLTLDGAFMNYHLGLREIIRDSGAKIVVVASENTGENYVAAAKKKPGYGAANLVLTLNRRGSVFPKFVAKLFTEMKNGTAMPRAWVKLAPQIPGVEHPECPDTIFACELGQVSLR